MAFTQVIQGAETQERHRRLVPVAVVVAVYLVVGTIWVFGGGPVADYFAEATSIPRWFIELGKGALFVTISAWVLHAVMRRRTDLLAEAAVRTRHDRHRLKDQETRNRLQATALSGTANAVVITDRYGTIEWVNPAFETMSGYPSSVAIGATPRLLHSGVQDKAFYRDLWETILGGQVWRGQMVNRRRDGTLYTVSQIITPVAAEDGEIQTFVTIQEDITERVRATSQLEASRLRLQSLFDHALDAIILADDHGCYIEVNAAACELTGYTHDELVGMGPTELASPDQQPADVTTQFDEFVRVGTESGTFALRHKDGHVVETEYRAVSNIQPGVHLSVLRDVTVRNRMLRALTVAEAEFRELAENAADIVIKLRIDNDGRIQVDYVNPAAVAILGYPRERLYSDADLLRELFHQRSDDLENALDLHPTSAVPTTLTTVQVKRADGRLVWLEAHAAVIDPSTTPVTIQVVARDVTARSEMMEALEQALQDQLRAAEELRTLNAMKDTFLQSVSHELRTPLTSVLGFAQLLADPRHGLSPADTQQFHKRILSGAQQLQRLLDDLLDVDRFTRGLIEPDRLPTDVTGLIERMLDALDLGDHYVELDLAPITMDLDTSWMERIVVDLLRNVVRHTPPETRVWIRTIATSRGMQLTVDDNGPGIPESDRDRLIQPFQQGTSSAASAQPGTGVGLSLVNAVAQMHGGTLRISDSPAGGARVIVTLAHAGIDTFVATAGLR